MKNRLQRISIKLRTLGTIIPITGFANSVVAPALEFQHEGYVLGTAAQMFNIAGPVLVYGTAASVLYGSVINLFAPINIHPLCGWIFILQFKELVKKRCSLLSFIT